MPLNSQKTELQNIIAIPRLNVILEIIETSELHDTETAKLRPGKDKNKH